MAGERGRSNESLHVLLARAGARVVATDDRDPEGDAAGAADVAAYGNAVGRDHHGVRTDRENTVVNIEDELRKMAETQAQLPEMVRKQARYDFVRLGDEIAGGLETAALAQVDAAKQALAQTRADAERFAAALIKIAEERVAQAEKNLAEVQDPANGLREEIKKVDQELADLNDRLKQFGATVLQAHRTFNGKADSENP